MTQATIVSFMGAVLICAGIIQIFARRFVRVDHFETLYRVPPLFRTRYPGTLMILIGVALLALGMTH
jgi:hypothetical protein